MRYIPEKLMMKMIAPLLALSLLGCGGKKATGDDCTSALDKATTLSKPEIAKLGVDDATQAKMKAISIKHCTEDKWDAAVVTCLANAKTYEDTLKCTDALAAAQSTKWTADMSALLPKTEAPPPTGSGSAAGSGSATGSGSAAGSGSGSGSATKGAMATPDCDELHKVVDGLAACTKLPKSAHDAYLQAATQVAAADCKATTAAIHESTATICK
jgi:small lipoprotein (TIGR04454 family)